MTVVDPNCRVAARLFVAALAAASLYAACASSGDPSKTRYVRAVAGSPGAGDGSGGGGAGDTSGEGGAGDAGSLGGSRSSGGAGIGFGGSAGRGGGASGGVGGASGGDRGGSGGAAGAGGDSGTDGCPDVETAGASDADHDGDGFHDVCDDDDDDDGIADGDDGKPLDASLPGTQPSPAPGFVLSHPCMTKALQEVEERGFAIPIERLRGVVAPPDGYFVRPEQSGAILAATDGAPIGLTLTGVEARRRRADEDLYDVATVDFFDTTRSFASGRDVVRGRPSLHTAFAFRPGSLTVASSVGEVGPGSDPYGIALVVSIPPGSTRYADCPTPFGTWRLSTSPVWREVEPARLRVMCVDENAGYIPNETWTRSGGRTCRCTLDFEVSCDP